MTAGALARVAGQNVALDTRKNESSGAGNTGAAARVRNIQFVAQVDGRDVVSLSSFVPQPFTASTLERADAVSDKLIHNSGLKRSESEELREDRVYRAMVAMRIMQKNGGEISADTWIGGLQPPSRAEMEAAYQRLTQRVIGVDGARDIDAARRMRLDLLDQFRDCDWDAVAGRTNTAA